MKMLKYIFFGNFWSFLLILSGIIDLIIGTLVITDIIHVTEHAFIAAVVAFGVGMLYLTGGIVIAWVKMKKEKTKKSQPVNGKHDEKNQI